MKHGVHLVHKKTPMRSFSNAMCSCAILFIYVFIYMRWVYPTAVSFNLQTIAPGGRCSATYSSTSEIRLRPALEMMRDLMRRGVYKKKHRRAGRYHLQYINPIARVGHARASVCVRVIFRPTVAVQCAGNAKRKKKRKRE